MPRKPASSVRNLPFFTWRIFRREGVFYADGRTTQHNLGKQSLGTRDSMEAEANLRLLDHQMAVKHGLARHERTSPVVDLPIENGWEKYLAHCQRSPVLGGVSIGTFKRYRTVRDKHVKYCDAQSIKSWMEFTAARFEAYAGFLHKREFAPRTVAFELMQIKLTIGWLIGQRLLPEAARIATTIPKLRGTSTFCYSKEQVAAMVAQCDSKQDLQWLGGVVVALACTGFRIGELASLRWGDIDVASETIRITDERATGRRNQDRIIRTTKGKRNRAIPLHPELATLLQPMNRHSDGRVFHGPRGGVLKPDTVRNIFIRQVIAPLIERFPTPLGEVGFEHGRLHSFRHFFCSEAIRSGASELEVKAWLGHRDSHMVAHYFHLRPEDGVRKLGGIDFLGRKSRTVRRSG